ncbi:glycosyltransferase [Actinotalea sp. AC32]|nr:glycosyltransferase [Actinotalea sp. AC32]
MSRPARASRLTVADVRRAAWHLRTGGVSQLRTWRRRRRAVPRTGALHARTDRDGRLTFEPTVPLTREPARPGLRVAVVLDDFSRLALRFEWDQREVLPSSWRASFEDHAPDLLFVESAWAGNGGAWRYHLTGPTAPRPALVEMVQWCRDHGVPTVFWNKEDPAHFADFLPTARLFDHVLTTDVTRVPAYVEELGHDRVGVMAFAAQPALHNPVRPGAGHAERDIAFAGMWFAHRHEDRRRQLVTLLDGAIRAGARTEHGLEIFSRQLGGDERYQFPAPYDAHVVGSLDYPRMLTAYKAYKVFLNVNTVVGSPTMCARRIVEITASGTPVVSTPSPAIDVVFPDGEVPQVDTADDAEHTLRALVRSPELRDRLVHRAQRRIWDAHTYGHRVDDVLDRVGLDAPRTSRRRSVSALVPTNRPHQLDHVLATVGAQEGLDVELVLLAHGFDVDEADLRARARDAGVGSVTLLRGDAALTLGECLNLLVGAAGGDVLAKMDDDDVYGPRYLSDQVHALGYSGADVVGKQAHYMHLVERDTLLLRFAEKEHRFTDLVMGPTIVARRDVLRDVPFAAVGLGEDTQLLRDVVDRGGRVYSADRFNFVQVRRSDAAHTWTPSDAELLATGEVVMFGDGATHVVF